MKVYINTAEMCITGKGWVKPCYYKNGDRITMEALTYYDISEDEHLMRAAGTEDFSPERMEATLKSAVLLFKNGDKTVAWKFFRYTKGNEEVCERYARLTEVSMRARGINFTTVEVKDWRDFI